MNINLLAFSIIFTFSIQCSCQNPESIIVSTNYGKLRGFVHILADSKQKIDIFFGIPFVHPPLGNLRFEKPLPPASWKEVRDAGEESKPSACVPHGRPIGGSISKFSEDCLYLNIFAPHKTNENNADALPILLLIHGGAYEIGSSARYSDYEKMGSRFVAKGVILVSIQYRLGVYGFASTGNNEMPGNLGIWDQIAALRWIKENIGAFGGDPLRVTVLGYSAGSGSTGLLSTTPAAKDLFHQTVRMSGSVLGNSGSGTFVPKNTMELAKAMNCSAANSFLKKCFKQKSVEEIFDGIEQIGAAPISYAIAKFSPYRMDKELFEIDHPEAIAKSPPKRTMLGFTELDFLLMTLIMDRNSSVSMLALTDEDVQNYGQPHFEAFLRNFVAKNEYFGEQIGQQIRAELFDFYVNKYEHKEEKDRNAEFYLRLYSMVCSDLMMVVPLLWESQMRIAANWPMYLYEFKYINPEVFPKRVKVHVAYHDYDHDLIFRDELTKNEDDKRIAAFLIESIVNFVKSGDPSSEAIEWKTTGNFSLTDSKSISHMEIGINPKQKEGMEGEIRRMHFWMQIRQKYGDKFDLIRGIYGNTATTSINAAGLFWPIVAIIISLTIMHFVG